MTSEEFIVALNHRKRLTTQHVNVLESDYTVTKDLTIAQIEAFGYSTAQATTYFNDIAVLRILNT